MCSTALAFTLISDWRSHSICRNIFCGRLRLQSVWCPVLSLLLNMSHIYLKKGTSPLGFFSVQRAVLRVYSPVHSCGTQTHCGLEKPHNALRTFFSSRPTGSSTYIRAQFGQLEIIPEVPFFWQGNLRKPSHFSGVILPLTVPHGNYVFPYIFSWA